MAEILLKDSSLRKFRTAIGLVGVSMIFMQTSAMATTEPPSEPESAPGDPELGTGPSGSLAPLPLCPVGTAYIVEGEFLSSECQSLAEPVPTTTPATVLLSNQGCDVPPNTEFEGYFTSPDQMGQLIECWIPELEGWLAQEYTGTTPSPVPNGYLFIPPTATSENAAIGCDYHDQDLFYCPQDGRIYLGAAALWDVYSNYGDVVPVIVLAHETGHFLQQYSGIAEGDQRNNPNEQIPYENQADCTSGVFLDYVNHRGGLTTGEQGVEDDIADVAQGMQNLATYESAGNLRRHGTMDQRMRSFYTGYLGNEGLNACNVFITDFNVFPTTGVETIPPVAEEPTVPAPAPTIQPTGLGTDASLNSLAQSCYDGDMEACDDLYEAAREVAGAEAYVSFADTCAGRQAANSGVWCRDAFISTIATAGPTTTVIGTVTPGSTPAPTLDPTTLGTDSTFNQLAQSCYDGNMQACDDLFEATNNTAGNDAYIVFGDTCAGRQAQDTRTYCRDAFPGGGPAGPTTTVGTVIPPGQPGGPTTTIVTPAGPSTTVVASGTPTTEHLSPITILMVGADIQAGEYEATVTLEGGRPCIWMILNSLDYVGDVPPEEARIAGGVVEEVSTLNLRIEPTDVALWSVDCGEWTAVPAPTGPTTTIVSS